LRILFDYRPGLRERTGVGEYVHELARALARADDQVILFSSSWKDRLPPADRGSVTLIDRRLPVRLLNFAWHRLEWPPIERLAGCEMDVAHSPHPLLLPARKAAQAVTIHDLDFLRHPERAVREIRRDYARLARDHARRADLVVVSSAFAACDVGAAFDIDPARIVVCPAGAPRWKRSTARPARGYILFFGTLEPRKNVGGLLDAYERLLLARRDVPELWLAGRETPAAGAWIDRASRAPLAGRVKRVGYVAPDHRRALYEGASVLVLPSFEEGFGLTALEAMATGVPVVASGRGALPELVGDAGLLIDPDDPDTIAGAMERILQDEALAAQMASRGLERASRFDWDTSARLLRQAYAAAVARRNGRAT
jgi:glycosyltransferase involved in cell wall biosynthesis